ncbi:MAG: hypothetical protein HGA53_10630 [Anaerolineaceae bacterium]|nr:hypothetical protein [Anaerolineaceae bacterium]
MHLIVALIHVQFTAPEGFFVQLAVPAFTILGFAVSSRMNVLVSIIAFDGQIMP